ncbi:leucyl aminopeptidase [Methylosinus sporium]|uniref:leucyl aminopeptidase n=1 Tax=Methylosinus sporium TaxID=428 RepID=UPI00383AB062
MSAYVKIETVSFGEAERRLATASEDGGKPLVLVAFAGAKLRFGSESETILKEALPQLTRAAAAAKFTGKRGTSLDLYAPQGLPNVGRLLVVGVGAATEGDAADKAEIFDDFLGLGGQLSAKLGQGQNALVVFDPPEAPADPAAAAGQFALGAELRAYKFDLYRTKKKKDDTERDGASDIALAIADPDAARAAVGQSLGLAEGVVIARDLVNEPANVLYPEEFARRAAKLAALGVEVEILDVPALQALGFRALLGVGQGSAHPSRVVVLRWNGGAPGAQPIAFVGKGVCFDTGGISIKPAASMEDMKGDMAGAAAVTGLLHALATRKAKANVIGVLGLVENMPSGEAQRPGDIVTSLSGQTIEIINTDAEGRLVLADALWHVKEKYKPAFIIDLATLTGAILVALGQEHAGLFSNNDELAGRILEAGKATGEKLWRLPMGPAYDKLVDSKFADMKNTGGRHAGSITAAQFLERFVDKTPWAHLDIAGTGMGSPASDINQSWASGWGVRLLDRLVKDYYEA